MGAKVTAKYRGEPIARILNRLKKRLDFSGWKADLHRHQYFIKPSDRKRSARNRGRRRAERLAAGGV